MRALVKAKKAVDSRERASERVREAGRREMEEREKKERTGNNNQRSDPSEQPVERHFVGPVFRVSSRATYRQVRRL